MYALGEGASTFNSPESKHYIIDLIKAVGSGTGTGKTCNRVVGEETMQARLQFSSNLLVKISIMLLITNEPGRGFPAELQVYMFSGSILDEN